MSEYFKRLLDHQRKLLPDARTALNDITHYDPESGLYKIQRDGGIVGLCDDMITVFYLIHNARNKKTNILLAGETGTGKELAAKALHYNKTDYEPETADPRKNYVVVNCASIPENLIESELFGSMPGAFTGAKNRVGAFEQANGGTIFLDEIGDMSLGLQTRLLRVLQEKAVQRLGDSKYRQLDFRFITATNKNLIEMVQDEKFRHDLYERISSSPIYLPSLKERGNDDIKALVYYFIGKATNTNPRDMITEESLQLIFDESLSGNARALEKIIGNAESFSRGQITPGDIKHAIGQLYTTDVSSYNGEHNGVISGPESAHRINTNSLNLDEISKIAIPLAIKASEGSMTKAAKILGIDRRTLYRTAKRLWIDLGESK